MRRRRRPRHGGSPRRSRGIHRPRRRAGHQERREEALGYAVAALAEGGGVVGRGDGDGRVDGVEDVVPRPAEEAEPVVPRRRRHRRRRTDRSAGSPLALNKIKFTFFAIRFDSVLPLHAVSTRESTDCHAPTQELAAGFKNKDQWTRPGKGGGGSQEEERFSLSLSWLSFSVRD
uniref:Uncharacterized protein n=1 Tax=Arundo donax TaxID=35708 RepID=A0A0A9DD45_ARUDO